SVGTHLFKKHASKKFSKNLITYYFKTN
ncbi:uncharacterized protein METZ01_LOCUS469983, partial [marine metagenome]